MLTKSKIQLIKESLAIANDYREGLENLTKKYNIEDSVFVYVGGMVQEATQGYFVEKSKHNSISEAIRHCNCEFGKYGIRIINNEEFIVGEIKRNLVKCSKDSTVFDINRLTDIR